MRVQVPSGSPRLCDRVFRTDGQDPGLGGGCVHRSQVESSITVHPTLMETSPHAANPRLLDML